MVLRGGASLICEDDWNVLSPNLSRWIGAYLDVPFDVLIIDPQGDYKKSDRIRRNLYRLSEGYPSYWGSHAYLVRNSSKEKILELLAAAPLDSEADFFPLNC